MKNLTCCESLDDDIEDNIDIDESGFSGGHSLPGSLMAVIQVFYGLICVLGLCGNTLVIYVVLRFSKMQTVTNIYILMLALADECFLVGIPFLIATSVRGDWIFGRTMCKVYLTTTSINQFTSSIFLTVMSADRYIAVCHPISSPRFRTPVIARCVSLSAWAASALLMVPVFMYAATITKPNGGQSCNIFWPLDGNIDDIEDDINDIDDINLNQTSPEPPEVEATTTGKSWETTPADLVLASPDNGSVIPTASDLLQAANSTTEEELRHTLLNGQSVFTFYSFVLGFAVPLLLILVFYVLVIVKLKTVGPKNRSKEKKRSHRKVTRLVLTVITVYILCWLPYWITQLALILTPPGQNQNNLMVAVILLAGCLSYSNSAMNPVLYAFLSENFKKSFMKACQCAATAAAAAARRDNNLLGGGNHPAAGGGPAAAAAGAANRRQQVDPGDPAGASRHHGRALAAARSAAISRLQQVKDLNRARFRDANGNSAGANAQAGNGIAITLEDHDGDNIYEKLNEMRDLSSRVTTRSCSSACPTTTMNATILTNASAASCSISPEQDCLTTVEASEVVVETALGSCSCLAECNQATSEVINGSLAPPKATKMAATTTKVSAHVH